MAHNSHIPSTKALFSALQELRDDPTIASVLAGEPDRLAGHRLPVRTPTSSSAAASGSVSPTPHTGGPIMDVASSSPSRVQHDAELFYRDRDSARDSVGVRNWLQKHRDELSNSESRRVDTRLKTEQLFAQSQLDLESVRLERRNESSLASTAPSNAPHIAGSPGDRRHTTSASEDGATQTAALLLGGVSSLSPPPPAQRAYSNDPQSSFLSSIPQAHRTAPRSLSPSNQQPQQQQSVNRSLPSQIVVLNTEAYFGPIDEQANYTQKRSAINANAGPSSPSPFFEEDMGGEDPWLREAAKDEVTALEEAVEHRDRTIRRLQRQLSEDRAYFEQQLATKDSELNELRAASESRVTALRSQIDELVTLRANRNAEEVTLEDLRLKLTTVQANYRDSVNILKQEATEKLEAMEVACQSRVQQILEASEEAVRSAKETFRNARLEGIAQERQGILDFIAREQDLRLREISTNLREQLRSSVLQLVIQEIEESFQKSLATHVVPALRRQIEQDALVSASAKLREECEGLFAQKLQSLRVTLLGELEVAEKRFSLHLTTEAEANGALPRPNQAVAAALDQRVAVVQQIVADVKAEEQRQDQLEALHQEKQNVYRKRIVQTNVSVEHEASFGKAILEQLHEMGTSVGNRAERVGSEEDVVVAPPFLAQAEREAAGQ